MRGQMRLSLKHWLRRHREPWTVVFYEGFKRWKRDGMAARWMLHPKLGPDSLVFDFGGFEGNWTADIHASYGCAAYVFEPHPAFAARLSQRFSANPSITIHPIALGSHDGTLNLSDDGDASSSFREAKSTVSGPLQSVARFFAEHDVPRIDLAKINIEGGEYDLLPALIDSGVIRRIVSLQVQFHLYSADDIARRDAIRQRLCETHDCDWNYDFVWEQWSLKTENS
jgi:FkbM family methyltransferase